MPRKVEDDASQPLVGDAVGADLRTEPLIMLINLLYEAALPLRRVVTLHDLHNGCSCTISKAHLRLGGHSVLRQELSMLHSGRHFKALGMLLFE